LSSQIQNQTASEGPIRDQRGTIAKSNHQKDQYMMNDYQREQLEALDQVRAKIKSVISIQSGNLSSDIRSYLLFRQQLDVFLSQNFDRYCTQACFENRASACCSKDGIITFWADVVLNVYHSSKNQIEELRTSILEPIFNYKCIYLSVNGCRWKIRPLGCALFLCDQVQADVLNQQPMLAEQWENFKTMGRLFRWPDRPVLFDQLEQVFMAAGCRSSLMYLNTSPGLLRIKQRAGLSQ
jgi:hypothetical protein